MKFLGILAFVLCIWKIFAKTIPCLFNTRDCNCTLHETQPPLIKYSYDTVQCLAKNGELPTFDSLLESKYTVTNFMQITGDVRAIPAHHFIAFEHIDQLTLVYENTQTLDAQINWHEHAFLGVTILTLMPLALDGVIPPPAAIKNIQGLDTLYDYYGPTPITLKNQSFMGMPNLRNLYIISTPINEIKRYAFSGLENQLINLKLIAVGLLDLVALGRALTDMKNMESLEISSNLITEIKRDVFPQMDLKHLWLINNPISHIEFGAFSNLHNLESIWMSETELALFDFTWFSDISTKAIEISLSDDLMLKNLTVTTTDKFDLLFADISLHNTALENIDSKLGEVLHRFSAIKIHIEGSESLRCEGLQWMSRVACPQRVVTDGCKCADKNGQSLEEYLIRIDPESKCRVSKEYISG